MAIDVIAEVPSLATSPRISFSQDLRQADDAAIDDPSLVQDLNSEFDFCTSNNSIEAETSSADELFSGGIIRPIQLHQRFVTANHVSVTKPQSLPSLPPLPALPLPTNSKPESFIKETSLAVASEPEPEPGQKQLHQSKSFWRIKRSSSVHCDNSHKKSSFWSLPLLSRSNSTGSVPNPKKESQRQIGYCRQPKNSSSYNTTNYISSQKPPLRKNYGGGGPYGHGILISPVLNVPPACICTGTRNLFGLGSFFRNGKDKKTKK